MEQKKFEEIIYNLNALSARAKEVADGFDAIKLIEAGTVKIKNYCEEAAALQSDMDDVNCDFYHFVGMEDFTVCQASQLLKAYRAVLQQRNKIKQIASAKAVLVSAESFTHLSNDKKYKYKIFTK